MTARTRSKRSQPGGMFGGVQSRSVASAPRNLGQLPGEVYTYPVMPGGVAIPMPGMVPMPIPVYTIPAVIAPMAPPPDATMVLPPAMPGVAIPTTPLPGAIPAPLSPATQVLSPVQIAAGVILPSQPTVPVSAPLPAYMVYFNAENDWKTRPLWQILVEELFGMYPYAFTPSTSPDVKMLDAYLMIRGFYQDPDFEAAHAAMEADRVKWEAYQYPASLQNDRDAVLASRISIVRELQTLKEDILDAMAFINVTSQGLVPAAYLKTKFGDQVSAISRLADMRTRQDALNTALAPLNARVDAIGALMSDHYNAYHAGLMSPADRFARYQDMVIVLAKDHPQALVQAIQADLDRAIRERDDKIAALQAERVVATSAEREEFIAFHRVEADLYINYGGLRESMARIGNSIKAKQTELRDRADWLTSEGTALKDSGPALQAYVNDEIERIKSRAKGVFSIIGEIVDRGSIEKDIAPDITWLKGEINKRQFLLQMRVAGYKEKAVAYQDLRVKYDTEIKTEMQTYEALKDEYAARLEYVRSPLFVRQSSAMYHDRKKFVVVNAGLESFIPSYMTGVSYLINTTGKLWDFRYLRGPWAYLKYRNEDLTKSLPDVEARRHEDIDALKRDHPEAFTEATWAAMLRFAATQGWSPMSDTDYRRLSVEYRVTAADEELKQRVTIFQKVLDRAEDVLLKDAGSERVDTDALSEDKRKIYYNLAIKFVNELASTITPLMTAYHEAQPRVLGGIASNDERLAYEKARRTISLYMEAQRLIKDLHAKLMTAALQKAQVESMNAASPTQGTTSDVA